MSQPADYWLLILPHFRVLFAISLVFMFTNLLLLTYLVFFTHEPSSRLLTQRISYGFLGQWVTLTLVPTLSLLNTNDTTGLSLSETTVYTLVLLLTALMAMATAMLDASVISWASHYSVRCQQALQLGVGLSTWIGCAYRLVTKAVFPQTVRGTLMSSWVYFYSGAMTLLLCLWVFRRVQRYPRVSDAEEGRALLHDDGHTKLHDDAPNVSDSEEEDEETLMNTNEPLLDQDGPLTRDDKRHLIRLTPTRSQYHDLIRYDPGSMACFNG
jgi:hypothetical protein